MGPARRNHHPGPNPAPDQDRFVYVAAEREEVAEARQYLKERGLSKTEASCFSYWTAPLQA
ncbi:SIP domain-containing protein [Alphaproteobacteria bacterium KMM 3653]|uniref:SIP domain-containing protein n=1 Tax=Harenicola maris TaxID=2841044 RepID=A0AAP2G4T1_9RHOB|nr:SIP domain-containing protein [Harenicola maris]